MKSLHTHWSLGAKLAMVGTPFLLLALLSTAATLWVSWQLEGGAGAVNEAGRMRMQTYRMALALSDPQVPAAQQLRHEFDQSLSQLRTGVPERPLFVPWNADLRRQFGRIEDDWRMFQQHWPTVGVIEGPNLRADAANFVVDIEAFVTAIESQMAQLTTRMHLLQMGLLVLAVLASATLLFSGYLFVLEPVGSLKQAIQKLQGGNLSARVEERSSDEFGTLAAGFNGMAEHLESMYRHLEARVVEKTAELEEKRERLESLYEVTTRVARAGSLDQLAQDYSQSVRRIARADGVALRWSDQSNKRYLMLAASGLPQAMVEGEHCLRAGECHCGNVQPHEGLNVIPIHSLQAAPLPHCQEAGFATVINVPIRLHDRVLGELDLFYHARVIPTATERSLLEALNSHLASAMENLRLNALEKEAAVSEERHLIARELHDSIAQSLAFLKIQVQLMRDALQGGSAQEIGQVLEEIEAGVRESSGDVRELLMHFRTRANAEDIEPALLTTLKKFEHQSGLSATLNISGQGLPLSPDLQVQVLHIVQEALSNVRKHSRASQVWLDVQQQPVWRFEVRDDGQGFDATQAWEETHVGLRIMLERAQRIGATVDLISTPSRGTSIVLTLAPTLQRPAQRAQTVAA